MNEYIRSQITYMMKMLDNFTQFCEIAALEDDGEVSKSERKKIKQIRKATEKYKDTLTKIGESK